MARLQFVKVGPIFRVPWVTLRDETEWVETAESGWNVLVGWESECIVEAMKGGYQSLRNVALYGGGLAAERMVSLLIHWWKN